MPPTKPKSDYIETETGNKVARRAQLHGTQHIILGGRVVIQPDVCIRGDLVRTSGPSSSSTSTSTSEQQQQGQNKAAAGGTTSVSIGRYTFISQSCILRPPHRIYKGSLSFHPLKIGEHTFIGEGSVIEAASVGDHVVLGKGVVLGNMSIVKDWVKVLDGAVVPGGMVIASGSVVGGRPARMIGELGDGWGVGGDGVEGGDLREIWRSVG